ncbi:MAG: hypothetical protein WBB28_08525 [Crinalium sp.]
MKKYKSDRTLEEIMQDSSSSSDNATSVLFPLFLCSIGINVLQHAWNSNQLAVLQQADNLQQQKIAQLQTDKDVCAGKLAGFIEGRR